MLYVPCAGVDNSSIKRFAPLGEIVLLSAFRFSTGIEKHCCDGGYILTPQEY
jgi:hypothetical protein